MGQIFNDLFGNAPTATKANSSGHDNSSNQNLVHDSFLLFKARGLAFPAAIAKINPALGH
jgi:hypothetical protein